MGEGATQDLAILLPMTTDFFFLCTGKLDVAFLLLLTRFRATRMCGHQSWRYLLLKSQSIVDPPLAAASLALVPLPPCRRQCVVHGREDGDQRNTTVHGYAMRDARGWLCVRCETVELGLPWARGQATERATLAGEADSCALTPTRACCGALVRVAEQSRASAADPTAQGGREASSPKEKRISHTTQTLDLHQYIIADDAVWHTCSRRRCNFYGKICIA